MLRTKITQTSLVHVK